MPAFDRSELELSSSEMRRLVDEAMLRITAHIESLPSLPSADVEGAAELARSLREPMPEQGSAFTALLDTIFRHAALKSFNTAGPGYLAYIPGGGIFHAALADLIAGSLNRYVGVFQAAPALAQLEANVVRWFCDVVGYPAGSGGLLTSGGSLANLIALVAARHERLGEEFSRAALYTSDQTHHSVQKAAALAGLRRAQVREIPSDASYRIRIEPLVEAIARDRRDGLVPFLLSGNAGTTNTGAVDDLEALAGVARRERMWFHVDGAYGGFFMMTARGREAMKGIEQADSITLDPHKGLFLPYGTGSLLVRDLGTLRRAYSHTAAYLPRMQEDPDLVDFCEISPELSRGFRGLRVWLPFKMHGAGAFRRALDEKLDLARWAAAQLEQIEGIELLAPPQLSLLAFRLARPGAGPAALNALNRQLLEAINARRRVFLTGTMLGEVFALRICVLSFRTHIDRMQAALDDVRAAVGEVTAG